MARCDLDEKGWSGGKQVCRLAVSRVRPICEGARWAGTWAQVEVHGHGTIYARGSFVHTFHSCPASAVVAIRIQLYYITVGNFKNHYLPSSDLTLFPPWSPSRGLGF